MYLPVAHILLSSKNKNGYNYSFACLKSLINSTFNVDLEIKSAIADFEVGL